MRICHSAEMLSMRFWCDWMCEWDRMEWAVENVWMIVLFRISARFTPIRTQMVFNSVLVLDNYDNDNVVVLCSVHSMIQPQNGHIHTQHSVDSLSNLRNYFFFDLHVFCILNIEKINWKLSVLLLEIWFAMEVHFNCLSWTHAF